MNRVPWNLATTFAAIGAGLALDFIVVAKERFEFVPGMLLVVRFDTDWSWSVAVGTDALSGTEVTAEYLQSQLNRVCASLPDCVSPFVISRLTHPAER